MFHDITHFLKQHIFLPLFPIVLVTNLITPITCQHLPNLISGHCQKFFSQNFNFPLLGNYIWLLNFLFNPSCTTPQTNIVTLGPLNSWFAGNVSRTLTLTNGLLNILGVFLIHKPIIRFTFSGRRITLFAPARLVDS